MNYSSTIPAEELQQCLLCHNAPCAEACSHQLSPDRILRSLRFENHVGAYMRLPSEDLCAACDAPCESKCLHPRHPVPIREIMESLREDGQIMEISGEEPPSLACDFCGVEFENPFLLSSSVVASSYEMIARAFEMGWAGAAYKTICDFVPREASPRFAALKEPGTGFYGFKNIEQLSQNSLDGDLEIIRRLKQDYPTKVIIASIMGRDDKEWARLAQLCEEAGTDILECNFSCPNMEENDLGCDIGQSPELVERFTRTVKRAVHIPVLAKLTPNVSDMAPAAQAAAAGGADGLAAINTIKSLMGMNLDTYACEPSVRGFSSIGGYSGKAVKPIALRFIWEMAFCDSLKGIPISGMGGVETWKDAVEFMLLGASTVQITTAVMQYGYRIIDDLREGLALYLQEKGQHSVSELIGMGISAVREPDELERCTIRYPKFQRDKCLGCGRCLLSCRDGGHNAIRMGEQGPILDVKRCVGCHLCVLVCPADAIRAGKRR